MRKQFLVTADRLHTKRLLRGCFKMTEVLDVITDVFDPVYYDVTAEWDFSRITVREISATRQILFEAIRLVGGRTQSGEAIKPPTLQSILSAVEAARKIFSFKRANEVITVTLLDDMAAFAVKVLARSRCIRMDGFPGFPAKVREIVGRLAPMGQPMYNWTTDARKEKLKWKPE